VDVRLNRTVLGLLAALSAAAAGPVRLSGSVYLGGQQSWAAGDESLAGPVSNIDFTLSPTLSLWGFPLSLDVLLSNQENPLRQQLDKFRLYTKPAAWALTRAAPPWLATAVQSAEIGTCRPAWTSLTLSGEPVTGAALELSPGPFYLAGAAGRTRRGVEYSDTSEAAFRRMLYAGRIGLGKREGTHFYLTGLYAQDDSNSISAPLVPYDTTIFGGDTIVDSLEALTPEENYLVGAELSLNLFQSGFTLESEIALSEHTRDTRMEIQEWDWLPGWAQRTFRPRLSTALDFAGRVRPGLKVLGTRLYGLLEFVGPGYRSLGTTRLRNDNLAWGAGIEREFFNRQVSVAASFKRERDNNLAGEDSAGNPLNLKAATTEFTSWAFDMGLQFRDLPYLQVRLDPHAEVSDSLTGRARVLSAVAGYDFLVASVSQSPSLSLAYEDFVSTGGHDDYRALDVELAHVVGFAFPLSVSASIGLARTTYAADTLDTETTTSFELAPAYTLPGDWSNSLTLGGSFDASSRRVDAGITSAFPIWLICRGQASVRYTDYSGDDGNYREWYMALGLSRSW
jgi:hypothetical protein